MINKYTGIAITKLMKKKWYLLVHLYIVYMALGMLTNPNVIQYVIKTLWSTMSHNDIF